MGPKKKRRRRRRRSNKLTFDHLSSFSSNQFLDPLLLSSEVLRESGRRVAFLIAAKVRFTRKSAFLSLGHVFNRANHLPPCSSMTSSLRFLSTQSMSRRVIGSAARLMESSRSIVQRRFFGRSSSSLETRAHRFLLPLLFCSSPRRSSCRFCRQRSRNDSTSSRGSSRRLGNRNQVHQPGQDQDDRSVWQGGWVCECGGFGDCRG